jgi:hypothetical protein
MKTAAHQVNANMAEQLLARPVAGHDERMEQLARAQVCATLAVYEVLVVLANPVMEELHAH